MASKDSTEFKKAQVEATEALVQSQPAPGESLTSWWMWMGAARGAFLIGGVSYALLREAPYSGTSNDNKLNPWFKPSTKQRAQKWFGDTGNSITTSPLKLWRVSTMQPPTLPKELWSIWIDCKAAI